MSADDRSGGIIVAGDVTIDWNLTRSAVGERDVWQWNAEDETHVYRQVGGASLLADVLEEVVADVGQARPVFRHISRPPNDASPADFAFPQSWAIWSLFPYEIGKYQGGAKTAWRVQEFLGLDRRVHRELCPPVPNVDGEDEPPFIVVLDDAALGFRDDRQVWPAALLSTDSRENLPAWILLKMAKPIAQGPLWEHLVTHFADRLIVTLAINDLRLMNVQVSRDVSWERTAEDLAWELLNNPLVNSLSQCAHVVVSFYTAGAFLLSGGLGRPRMGNTAPRAELLFDPLLVDVPGDEARRRTSVPLGSIHSMKKAEARRKLRTMLEEMGLNGEQHLEHTSLGGKTFNTEAAWWREQKLSKYKPSCQETMAGHLDKYLIPQLGSLPMAAIDERRVQELITEMERVEYTRSDGVKKRLSPKSICNVIGVLKLMLGKKVWRDWNLVFPENIDPDKERRYFTQAEMIQVVNAAEGQWKVLFALMAGSGLRTGEVSGLEIEDLDLEAGLIRVRRGIWKGRAITPKTKRGKRTVFIEPTLVSMLCSYLEGRTSGRVFQTASGKPHSRHNVWRKLKLILKSLGLQPGGLHAFRHGRVSMLQANGMPGDLLLEQVGHSNLKTTSGYTHFDDAFRQRMARVQGLFSQEDGPNGPKFPDFPSTGRVM